MAERVLTAVTLAALLVICALALREGVRATGDLDWPFDPDLFRDIAQSQTFLQGRWDGDPFYKQGKLWYSPLVPAAVAVGSRLTDSPPHRFYARAGAYLNLLAPLCFFVLVGGFFDRTAALGATFCFVFLSGQDLPPFASATYSPWLFPGLFAQSLFFLSLIALERACAGTSLLRYALAGLACGITFLAHAAPGLLLLGIGAAAAVRPRGSETRGAAPGALSTQWLAFALSALVVSLPLLWTIGVHYGLETRNPVPGGWQWPLLHWSQVDRLAALALSWASVVALLGVFWTWRRKKGSFETRALGAWAAVCFVMVGYGYLARRLGLPRALPSHHFVFYLKALESLFFGVGLSAICGFVTARLGGERAGRSLATPLVTAAVLGLVALHYPAYRERPDFTLSRRKAELVGERSDRVAAFAWIEANTRPDDVFLCEDDLSLYVVGPAGRKVVAVDRHFTNPYLDWEYRNRRRNRMLQCLAAGDEDCFRMLASAHEVSFVLMEPARSGGLAPLPFLEKVFERGRVQIYGIRPPAGRAISPLS